LGAFFNGRTVIKAEDLKGPRVYSTDLVPSLFDVGHVGESVAVAARALKIKILTKGLVTLNSAYLISPLAIHLFDAHPDVLSGPAILPAFRIDKNGLEDLVTSNESMGAAGIDESRLREHIARIDQSVKQVMPWDLGNVGEQFKRLILEGLRNNSSTIYHALSSVGLTAADTEKVAHDIESIDFRDSVNLRNYISDVSQPARGLLSSFSTACYHINGTSVVQCETGTDLSPLSDFKAADVLLAARDARPEILSDEAVFLEAFMGFALDTIQASILPSQMIDALDFKTIHALSGALREEGFQDKYDGVVRQYVTNSGLADARQALDSLDEEAIAGVAGELAKAFKAAIIAELPGYKLQIQSDAKGELIRAGTDVAREAAGMVPVLSNVIAFADTIGGAADKMEAVGDFLTVRDQGAAFSRAREKRTEEIKKAIVGLNVSEKKKTKLLDAVALLSDVHGISIRRA
jgi:hypothetical protein